MSPTLKHRLPSNVIVRSLLIFSLSLSAIQLKGTKIYRMKGFYYLLLVKGSNGNVARTELLTQLLLEVRLQKQESGRG